MTEIISEFTGVVEKRFCTRCNREVSYDETLIEQNIISDNGYIVRIDEQLLHGECGGIIRPLLLNYRDH